MRLSGCLPVAGEAADGGDPEERPVVRRVVRARPVPGRRHVVPTRPAEQRPDAPRAAPIRPLRAVVRDPHERRLPARGER
eukprot:11185714-Alexandrium_andersonii.AAC.1